MDEDEDEDEDEDDLAKVWRGSRGSSASWMRQILRVGILPLSMMPVRSSWKPTYMFSRLMVGLHQRVNLGIISKVSM